MRKLIALAVVVAVVVTALAIPALGATRTMTVGDRFYIRKGSIPTTTIRRGSTALWVWRGKQRHNVTAVSGPVTFHSRTFVHGSYSRTMTRRGTYRIVCTIHPGMEMVLRVK